MSNQLARGSVLDHANRTNQDIAASFMDVRLIILADRSGSMLLDDITRGEVEITRQQAEDELVAKYQAQHEGKLLIASFASYARVHVNGILPKPAGATYMLEGLELIKPYVVGDIRILLISDGEPSDSESAIIHYVQTNYRGKLDTAYAGEKGGAGEAFMLRLAHAALGKSETNVLNNPDLLNAQVTRLLSASV